METSKNNNSTSIKDEYPKVKSLKCKASFDQLNEKEKLYAYYFYKASWSGFPIVLFNMSPEGPLLFVLFQKFFKSFESVNKAFETIISNLSKEIAMNFFEYVCNVYDNAGNYRSFGFDKIYSKIDEYKFKVILDLTPCNNTKNEINDIFNNIKDKIFDTSDKTKSIGFNCTDGVNNYYLGNIEKNEIDNIDDYLLKNNIYVLNTRLIKFNNKNSNNADEYAYLVGSVNEKVISESKYNNMKIHGIYGDFSEFLNDLNVNLKECKKYISNNNANQINMIDKYIESFDTGSIEAHKQSQIHWVKDVKPVVETNIGWIETYVDPKGLRGYYEGMVAIVDKENSKKYTTLVNNAKTLLDPKNIPWPSDFENYPFKEPDYTQIDVVAFASDGCPLGINIPNYSDIVENHGFKNVTIGNNLPSFKASNISFMKEEDKIIYEKYAFTSMNIHTACHELLGHGSGKLLRKTIDNNNKDGCKYNFNYGVTKDPLTNKLIDDSNVYIENETFESRFSSICRSYEECRADLSGLFFGKMKSVCEIFNIKENEIDNCVFSKWNMHVRKGILGLKFYNEKSKKWGQAHVQGAYVFTSYILKNQDKHKPIIKLEFNNNKTVPVKDRFIIQLNKEEIINQGHKLVENMLLKLNIWKSTGNFNEGSKFYEEHSIVDEYMLKIKDFVVENTPPRALTINNNLFMDVNNNVYVKEYEESFIGLIESYIDRYTDEDNRKILRQHNKWDDISSLIN